MKRILIATVAAFALGGCAALSDDHSRVHALHHSDAKESKIAFDITDGNPHVLMLKLNTIDLTRKQLIDAGITPKMVLAFRGDASYYTQTNLSMVKETDRADALAIRAKLKELSAAKGVEKLEQCNVPLASRKLKPADLMQEVKLVPNGWIALAEHQKDGYSYIVP